jgi:orotidine 5'-phosphate decarboxylase subfamily 2
LKFLEKLDKATLNNNSLLCVGLDIDMNRVPQSILNKEDPIYLFNIEIIKATKDLVCAYKPNIAFYERYGVYGLSSLIKTIEYIQGNNIPVILDAKRGDIGHSSAAYAESIFNVYKADAVTVNPYLGHDSLEPFLDYQEKGIIILCMTSNPGAREFQKDIYLNVAREAVKWNQAGNCGLVVGATKPEELAEIRKIVGDMPLLIPGVGAQGGDLSAAVKAGVNKNGNRAIINASRSIIYADDVRAAAKNLRDEINKYRWPR